MANIRQSIIIRTDLGLPIGLLAAQVAHLHMERVRDLVNRSKEGHDGTSNIVFGNESYGDELEAWLNDPYLFVHKVPCREALELFRKQFVEAKIPVNDWRDTVSVDISPTQRKVFEHLLVGISIGPCDSDAIKAIISDLPLL